MMRSVYRLKPLPITQQRVSQSDETGKKKKKARDGGSEPVLKESEDRGSVLLGRRLRRRRRRRRSGWAVVGGAPPADDGRARDCSTCTLTGHAEATHEQHGGLTDARSSRNIHRSGLGFRLATSISYLFHQAKLHKMTPTTPSLSTERHRSNHVVYLGLVSP